MKALRVYAGERAAAHLRERGLRPEDIAVVPGAAGGPKGLALNWLDRFLFGHWLAGERSQPLHLLGASVGAWRLACACLPDPDAALARMADDYIHERYDSSKKGAAGARHVSEVFARRLSEHFEGREQEVLSNPTRRLHVFTSRGRHALLKRQGRWRTPLGYLGAFAANTFSRSAMSHWLERVIFSDPRDPLPLHVRDYLTQQVALTDANLRPSILASGSIPFWLDAVHDIPGAPAGAYWDGGITDYHLHLDYASMTQGLVLYPHFQKSVIPGWLDKTLRHRHRATERLSNVVLLAPDPDWVKTLPNGKLPDRGDFKAYGDDTASRVAHWERAVAQSRRLADEFEALASRPGAVETLPL